MLEFEFDYESDAFGKKDKAKVEAAIIHFMEDVADKAAESFRAHVPRDSDRTYHAIEASHVEKTPYGWSISVGINPIESSELEEGESPDYPLFVHEGTGLFGERSEVITPLHGNIMIFEAREAGPFTSPGDIIATRWVQGQRPQPYLEQVENETNQYIRVRKKELAAVLNAILS